MFVCCTANIVSDCAENWKPLYVRPAGMFLQLCQTWMVLWQTGLQVPTSVCQTYGSSMTFWSVLVHMTDYPEVVCLTVKSVFGSMSDS